MNCEKAPLQITVRSVTLSRLIQAFAFILTLSAAHADSTGEGVREKFQLRLNNAWHNLIAGKPSKNRVPFNIAPGEKYLMNCSPEHASSRDKRFTISFGEIDIPKNFSLVFIDEFQKVLVVAANSYGVPAASDGAYIGDNTIQPELIKKNSAVMTEPLATYAHMNDTGYPYAAFGPSGTYAILLVDDAIDFERQRMANKVPSVVTNHGKIPGVIAGCAVTWTRLGSR